MDFTKISYEEIDGKIAVTKSIIFALNFRMKKLQAEILRQESEVEKMRNIKLQKIFENAKPLMTESDIDFSFDDFKSFLLNKKIASKQKFEGVICYGTQRH